MAKKKKLYEKDRKWMDLQGRIQDNIEEHCDEISKLFENHDANQIFTLYFLMFWTRVLKLVDISKQKYDNTEAILAIKRMMDGDLPEKMNEEDINSNRILH